MTRLLLINPNTNAATTNMMRAIAQAAAPGGTVVDAMSAPYGVPLITDEQALEQSAKAVQALAGTIATTPPDGVIISAFGDPGLAALRLRLSCPVTGIAEAGMAEAGSGRRPFAVVTTTPDLADSITALAHAYGHGATMRGVALTEGDVHAVMADHGLLVEALAKACAHAIETLGAKALVIGGGPLGQAAAIPVDALSGAGHRADPGGRPGWRRRGALCAASEQPTPSEPPAWAIKRLIAQAVEITVIEAPRHAAQQCLRQRHAVLLPRCPRLAQRLGEPASTASRSTFVKRRSR